MGNFIYVALFMANNFFILNRTMVTIRHAYTKTSMNFYMTSWHFLFPYDPLTFVTFKDQIKTTEILLATVTIKGQTGHLLQSNHAGLSSIGGWLYTRHHESYISPKDFRASWPIFLCFDENARWPPRQKIPDSENRLRSSLSNVWWPCKIWKQFTRRFYRSSLHTNGERKRQCKNIASWKLNFGGYN